MNLDEYPDIGTHMFGFYSFNVTYFDNFGVQHIQKKKKKNQKFIGKKNIQANDLSISNLSTLLCKLLKSSRIAFNLSISNLCTFTKSTFLANFDVSAPVVFFKSALVA